jgi:hypothetical protein
MQRRSTVSMVIRIMCAVVTVVLALEVLSLADTATAALLLTGGTLGVTAQDISFSGFQLDGQDHSDVSGTTISAWTAVDATGTGSGWHVNVACSDFVNGSYSIPVGGLDVNLLDGDVAIVDGNTKPTSSVTDWTALSQSGIAVLSAGVGEGMGSYVFTPTFRLDVPAETYAGNYAAYITVTISTGPQ